jgi:hypothetical protein
MDKTKYTLSLSYGKDSLACLGAIELLGLPLTDIYHAEILATDEIPAELPPMIEFKERADKIIKERWGIEVKKIYAKDKNGDKLTYEKCFYSKTQKGAHANEIYGFPCIKGQWCNSRLKVSPLDKGYNGVKYLGIAADELERIEKHINKKNVVLPLVLAGWDEKYCLEWCKKNDLLSPIYEYETRGGVLVLPQSRDCKTARIKEKTP